MHENLKRRTYIDGSDGDHVGAVELQPHLLNGSPELPAALGALPVHLHDVQAGGEDLGLSLGRVGGEGTRRNTEQTCAHNVVPFREITETSRHRGDDEPPAAFVHLQLLDGDAELGEEIQAEAVHRWTLHVHHGHAYRQSWEMNTEI